MKPEDAHEKQAVYFDRQTRRGLILAKKGDLALIWPMPATAEELVEVPLEGCEPFPFTHCFACGKKHHVQNEERDREAALKRVKEDFGAVPPLERRISLCKECGLAIYEKDKKETHCICAFSRGESKRCVCEWRRARSLPVPKTG